MDMELLLDIGAVVGKLKMYPYFDIANYILMCLQVKDDLPSGGSGQQSSHAQQFSRRHPFACWVSSMLLCFSGGILASFLLGEPVIKPLLSHRDIATATIVWYIIFYSPFDLVFKITRCLPVKLIISLVKEVQRAHKILDGVTHVAHLYPDAYFLMVLIGTIKGSSYYFILPIERAIRGGGAAAAPMTHHSSPSQQSRGGASASSSSGGHGHGGHSLSEFLQLSFTTKYSAAASMVFVAANLNLLPEGIPFSLVYLGIVFAFMTFRLAYLLFHIHDPLRPIENLIASILLGGMWDALRVATMTMRPSPVAADAAAAQGAAGGAGAVQPAGGSSQASSAAGGGAGAEGEGKKNK